MTATVIIPARFGSTRFAGKMLASATGRPMVQHVVEQARKCRRVQEVIVATDDARIADALRPFGTRVAMTAATHQSGTDRIAEVARSLTCDLVVNVQGDEPEIEPEIIDALIDRLELTGNPMSTAATAFPAGANPADPNLVKVVVDRQRQALFFSRSPIPYRRDGDFHPEAGYNLHLGIYAFHRDFLLRFAELKPTPLELTEKLEQLRALEHGHRIDVLHVERASHGIDTQQQYEAFVDRYKGVASC